MLNSLQPVSHFVNILIKWQDNMLGWQEVMLEYLYNQSKSHLESMKTIFSAKQVSPVVYSSSPFH